MIQVLESVEAWRQYREDVAGWTIGFVPTMGALHAGHASLMKRCRAENEIAVASIFVNPTQFNDPQDLERYPRTMAEDVKILEDLGTDAVLAPPQGELYPRGYCFRVEANCRGTIDLMEGLHRPGFFQGVLTVVLKLLNVVRPERVYFGEKDFQQLRMVRQVVEDFLMPVEIVACPTVRTASGLAESSRNRLLSPEGLQRAAALYHALHTAADVKQAKKMMETAGLAVEYVEEHWGRRLAAVYLEGVRLIDNVAI